MVAVAESYSKSAICPVVESTVAIVQFCWTAQVRIIQQFLWYCYPAFHIHLPLLKLKDIMEFLFWPDGIVKKRCGRLQPDIMK